MMTPEQRLDRLERIANLMVKAGLRARRQSREQDEKIKILIHSQIKNEDRFALLAESQRELAESQRELTESQRELAESQRKLAESQRELAESQSHTDRRLDALIDIIRDERNGKPPAES